MMKGFSTNMGWSEILGSEFLTSGGASTKGFNSKDFSIPLFQLVNHIMLKSTKKQQLNLMR